MYRERRLPPSEAQRVLARALELQRAEGGGRELGAEELSRTLRDLGVEERFVQQALQDDETSPAEVTGKPSRFIGSPMVVVFERRVARVLETADHARLIAAIRRIVGDVGQTEVIGDQLAWTMSSGRRQQRRLRVTMTPSREGTTIRVEENLRAVAGGLFGGILGALGANALVWAVLAPTLFHAPLWIPPLLLGVLLAVWVILRVSFGAFVGARRRQLAELVEKVAAEVASEARPAPMRVEGATFTRVAPAAQSIEDGVEHEAPEDSSDAGALRGRE